MFCILQILGIDSTGSGALTALTPAKTGDSLWLFICDTGESIWRGTGMPTMLGVELPFLGRRPLVSNCILASSLLLQHW